MISYSSHMEPVVCLKRFHMLLMWTVSISCFLSHNKPPIKICLHFRFIETASSSSTHGFVASHVLKKSPPWIIKSTHCTVYIAGDTVPKGPNSPPILILSLFFLFSLYNPKSPQLHKEFGKMSHLWKGGWKKFFFLKKNHFCNIVNIRPHLEFAGANIRGICLGSSGILLCYYSLHP